MSIKWSALLRLALVGTGRMNWSSAGKPPQLNQPESPITKLIEQLDPPQAAQRLLLTAGVQHLYEAAGAQPLKLAANRRRSLAERDERPLCPASLSTLFEQILNGQNRILLEPFLQQLANSGYRLPAHLVPSLLAYGSRIHRFQPYIIQILGPHGVWLAQQNPKWAYATLNLSNWEDLLRRWHGGKLSDQTRLLGQIRFFDPDLARQLLENVWQGAPPNNRLHFIRQLDTGLSMADEPFLERVLDDRHQPIRRLAATLLARLPQSRYAQRMGDYLASVIHWRPGRLGAQGKLTVKFPTNPSAAMIRDGIPPLDKRRPGYYIKQQLTTIAAAAPLDAWQQTWHADPEQIVDAIVASGWTKTLLGALTRAAWQQPQRGADWALPLAQADQFSKHTLKLLSLLPPAEYSELLLLLVDQWQEEGQIDQLLFKGLWRDWPHIWSTPLALKMTTLFADYIRSQKDTPSIDLSIRSLYLRFMRHAPPDQLPLIEEILEPAAQITPLWRSELVEGLNLLRFRGEMENAFQKLNA